MDVSRLYPVSLIIADAGDAGFRRTIALPQYISQEDFGLLVSAAFEAPSDLGITAVQDEMSDVVYPIAALLENPAAFAGEGKAYKVLMSSAYYRERRKKKGISFHV